MTAFRRIAESRAQFFSRGDNSGTHIKEQELWAASGITTSRADWYHIARSGMAGSAATAREAATQQTYTLLDRATSSRSDSQ